LSVINAVSIAVVGVAGVTTLATSTAASSVAVSIHAVALLQNKKFFKMAYSLEGYNLQGLFYKLVNKKKYMIN